MADTQLLPEGMAVVVKAKHGRLYAIQDSHGNVTLETRGREITLPRESARDLAEGILAIVGLSEDDYWHRRREEAEASDSKMRRPEDDWRGHSSLRLFDKIAFSDLEAYGLLPSGSVLTCNVDGETHEAVTMEGGRLKLGDGSVHESPSVAFKAATGGIRNGWKEWQTPDGIAINWLRWQLGARRPATDSATPHTTLHSRCELMRCWVNYCREQGMKPNHCDKRAVDRFINEYCPSNHADPAEMREVMAGWFLQWERDGEQSDG